MEKNQTIVTMPSYNEILGKSAHLTDYALLSMRGKTLDRDAEALGEFWLRDTGALRDEVGGYRNNVFYSRHVDNQWMGVKPCFVNPEVMNMGLKKMGGRNVLTINGEVVYYPHRLVPNALSDRLDTASAQNDPALKLVGGYVLPTAFFPEENRFNTELQVSYAFENRQYVHAVDHDNQGEWFACEPVRAHRDRNGTIHCQDILLIAPMNSRENFLDLRAEQPKSGTLDLSQTALGKFMQTKFLKDLVLSTEVMRTNKLAHVNPNYRMQLRFNRRQGLDHGIDQTLITDFSF